MSAPVVTMAAYRPSSFVTRMDLVGHSLAAEGGATLADFGAWHKIATHLQPARLKTAAKGGAMCACPEGTSWAGNATPANQTSGYFRTLWDWPAQARTFRQPYLANSQLATVFFGANDVAWLGASPSALNVIKNAMRTLICRFRASVVFEDTATTAVNGMTPVAYTGTWTFGSLWGYTSNCDYHFTTQTYPTAYATITVPPDLRSGDVLQFGFFSGQTAAGDGALWDIVDVTDFDTTTTAALNAGANSVTVTSATGIRVGATVTIDTGTNAETLTVQTIAGTTITFTANATKTHASGVHISGPGLLQTFDSRAQGGVSITETTAGRKALVVTARQVMGAPPTTTLTQTLDVNTGVGGTINVTSTDGFPAAGFLLIEDEHIQYSAKTATTFTIANRGLGPSGPQPTGTDYWKTHASGLTVTGSRSIQIRPITVAANAYFDFWAIEASQPYTPLIMVPLMFKPNNYSVWSAWPYGRFEAVLPGNLVQGANTVALPNTTLNGALTTAATTITVASTANFAPIGAIQIGSEIIVYGGKTATTFTNCTRGAFGTTAAAPATGTAVYSQAEPGETITIGSGAGVAETFAVQSVAQPNVTLNGNLARAHNAGELLVLGYQDADIDNFNAMLTSLVAEFNDPNIFVVPTDDLFNKDPQFWSGDGVHLGDMGHAVLAQRMLQFLYPRMQNLPWATRPAVPENRSWISSTWGDQVTLLNTWANFQNNEATTSPNLGYYKDMQTGLVVVKGDVYPVTNANANDSSKPIFTLPPGHRPRHDLDIPIVSDRGAAVVRVKATGDVCPAGNCGYYRNSLNLSFLAEQ